MPDKIIKIEDKKNINDKDLEPIEPIDELLLAKVKKT